MEKDILTAIIETEKEIQESLERERHKSVMWLENAKKEIEAVIAAEELELEESCRKGVADARENARGRADALLRDVVEKCRRLTELSDEKLICLLMEHIGRIRPENNRDSQDVEG